MRSKVFPFGSEETKKLLSPLPDEGRRRAQTKDRRFPDTECASGPRDCAGNAGASGPLGEDPSADRKAVCQAPLVRYRVALYGRSLYAAQELLGHMDPKTTTPKVRAAIQVGDEPARVVAQRYGTTEQTV